MAIQTFKGGFFFPSKAAPAGVGPAHTTAATLDASGEKLAYIFQAPKTGSIRKGAFRTGTVTTGDTVDVRFETVDLTTGFPTGTLFGANTNVSHTVNAADDNVWLTTAALTADASVTRGDLLAMVVVNGSTPGNMILSGVNVTGPRMQLANLPYNATNTSGSYAVLTNTNPCFAVEYSDGSYEYIPSVYPAETFNTISIATNTSGTTGDERGFKFQLPFSYQVCGAWAWMNVPGNTNCDFILYDSDGTTALLTYTFDGNVDLASVGISEILFSSSATLLANTNYRIVLKPSTTTTMTMYDMDVDAAAVMDACEGGQNWHLTYRTDAGAWTDTTTKRPFMGLRIDGIDVSSGGVGGNRHHRHLGALTW